MQGIAIDIRAIIKRGRFFICLFGLIYRAKSESGDTIPISLSSRVGKSKLPQEDEFRNWLYTEEADKMHRELAIIT